MKKELTLFILIPLTFNLLFFALYFSGIDSLQQIVGPRIPGILPMSWREFGIVELLQNVFLVAIVALFMRALVIRKAPAEKIFFLTGTIVMLFLLLEEIDYGLHFYHYFSDQPIEIARFNWHNEHTFSDNENGKYLRRISDFGSVFWFTLMPLISIKVNFRRIHSIIPSLWFIPALIVSALCSSLGHFLEDRGMSIINGTIGVLEGNISEFRETTTYYIYFLYAIQLVRSASFDRESESG